MKKIIYLLSIVIITLSYCMVAKMNAFKIETGQDALDNRNAQSESDNAINDVDNAVSNTHTMNAKVILFLAVLWLI